jgi:hypothetical protein
MKFYPSDWLGSSRLRRCSLEARGLAIELICHMHQGEPYGHLTVKGNAAIAKLVGIHHHTVGKLLGDLVANGVCNVSPTTGVIFSPRMVRDYEKELKDQEIGKLGGNPALVRGVNPEVNPTVNPRDQIPDTRKSESTPDTPPIENGQPRRKQTVFPEGWKPTTEHFARAQTLGLSNLHVERAAVRFEDHHIAKGSTFADWDRAFNAWLNGDADHLGKPAQVNGASVDGFIASPGSAAFSAWKAHCTDHSDDPKCRSLKRLLENYEQSGKSFNFETEWPPQ